MAALLKTDRLLRVDYGPSLISIADVHRNVCYPHTHRSQFGHFRSSERDAKVCRDRTFKSTLPRPKHITSGYARLLPVHYWITSFARSSSDCGTVRPSA